MMILVGRDIETLFAPDGVRPLMAEPIRLLPDSSWVFCGAAELLETFTFVVLSQGHGLTSAVLRRRPKS